MHYGDMNEQISSKDGDTGRETEQFGVFILNNCVNQAEIWSQGSSCTPKQQSNDNSLSEYDTTTIAGGNTPENNSFVY